MLALELFGEVGNFCFRHPAASRLSSSENSLLNREHLFQTLALVPSVRISIRKSAQ